MKITSKHILFAVLGIIILVLLYLFLSKKEAAPAEGTQKPPKTEPSDVTLVNPLDGNEATEAQVDDNFGEAIDKNTDGYFDDTDEATRLLNQRVLDDARDNYRKTFGVTEVPLALSAGALNTLAKLFNEFLDRNLFEVIGVTSMMSRYNRTIGQYAASNMGGMFPLSAQGTGPLGTTYRLASVNIGGQHAEDLADKAIADTKAVLLSVSTEEQLQIILARF